MGAWIETNCAGGKIVVFSSRLSWARGLKQQSAFSQTSGSVAPLVGAWIETVTPANFMEGVVSRLSWARGLKQVDTLD